MNQQNNQQTNQQIQDQQTQEKIAFIGAGNMASAIIAGLLHGGRWKPQQIIASNPSVDKLKRLGDQFAIQTTQDNNQAVDFAKIVIIAVKPQQIATVCRQLAKHDLAKHLLISVVAGYSTQQLEKNLQQKIAVVRAMPNTPSQIGCGASGLFATDAVSKQQKQIAQAIFDSIGKSVWIEQETHMDIVTAIAGSGPAYFMLLIQAMLEQAEQAGLEAQQAFDLISQTVLGTARLVQFNQKLTTDKQQYLISLREKITSPGGTTQAAIDSLMQNNFTVIVKQAVEAAIIRGGELAKKSD